MKREIAFEYQVIRYAHDPSSGESLNVGVIVYAASERYLECTLDGKYKRLSDAFSGFDGDFYRSVVRRFKVAIETIKSDYSDQHLDLWPTAKSLDSITSAIWPDCGLSYQFSATRAGVTEDLHAVLDNLYARFVTDQFSQDQRERRTDDDVWSVYQKHLSERNISTILQPQRVTTDLVEIKFDHAYRNGHLYALQPLSMDLTRSDYIQNKATSWLGKAVAVNENPDLAKIYVLLGKPSNPALIEAYEKAKHLLSKAIGVRHVVIEEDDAVEFAEKLWRTMTEQGVLPEPSPAPTAN